MNRGLFFRDSRFEFDHGVKICFNEKDEKQHEPLVLEIPAEALEVLKDYDLLGFMKDLQALGFSCTRLDESFDDYDWLITPQEVHKTALSGNVAGFRKVAHAGTGKVGACRDDCGFTCYLGTRGDNGSGKFLRIYDKKAESEGVIDAVRWEVEWSQKRAQVVFVQLVSAKDEQELARLIARHVGGSVDFVDRTSGDHHLDRLPRLGWWTQVLTAIGMAKIRVERVKSTYASVIQWVQRSLSSTLTVLYEVQREVHGTLGPSDFFRQFWETGKAKLKGHHRKMVNDGIADGLLTLTEDQRNKRASWLRKREAAA